MNDNEYEMVENGGGSQEQQMGTPTEGGSDAEDADNFLLTFSQASTADLTTEKVLRYEWMQSKHLSQCKRSTQVGQLCIFASKAKIADMTEIQRISAEIATAESDGKPALIKEFVEEYAEIMGNEGIQIPQKLTDKVTRREMEDPEVTPTSTPVKKRRVERKQAAKMTAGLTVNPFNYLAQIKAKEVLSEGGTQWSNR